MKFRQHLLNFGESWSLTLLSRPGKIVMIFWILDRIGKPQRPITECRELKITDERHYSQLKRETENMKFSF